MLLSLLNQKKKLTSFVPESPTRRKQMRSTTKTYVRNCLNLPVPPETTVTHDHQVTQFLVTVRHMNNVAPDTIKNILQTKLEVTDITTVNKTVYVQ